MDIFSSYEGHPFNLLLGNRLYGMVGLRTFEILSDWQRRPEHIVGVTAIQLLVSAPVCYL